MPILFMGLMALAVLAIMGGLLFFAIYEERHDARVIAEKDKPREVTHA